MMTTTSISVIIPTLQAGATLSNLINALKSQQTPPNEIILVDSGSTDETLKIADQSFCVVESINSSKFRHGRARNLGAHRAHGDVLVFLTQDALPVDDNFLGNLIRPLEGNCAAAYARQIPYPDANPLEIIARNYNYPLQTHIRTVADVKTMGIKSFFFSNSASAILRTKFWMIGGFSEEVIVNEDMLFCAKFLNVGETVTYTSEASVYHSHNYSLEMLFRRYFDIGVFFAQGAVEMAGISAEGEGFRFIIRSIQTLLTQRKFQWIPRLFIETIVKIIAFWVGISYKHLTPAFCSHLSTQPFFWLPDRVNEK